MLAHHLLKFIYSQRATKYDEISILVLMLLINVKTNMEISIFLAFSENLNYQLKVS